MRLTALSIQRMPGIDRPLAITGLTEGITVISGPNASGKSSLIRALRYLLAPTRSDPSSLVLEAELQQDGHTWRVQRTSSAITWTRDGVAHEPPPLPDAETLQSYWLQIDNLLAASNDDERLSQRFQQALAGGFDLNRLTGDKGPFRRQTGRDRDASRRLRQAAEALRQAERENRALYQDQQELPALDAAIIKAREAERNAAACQTGLDIIAARRRRQHAEHVLGQFPPHMEHCPDEATLRRVEAEFDTAEQRAREAASRIDEADRRLADSGFAALDTWPDPTVGRAGLSRLQQLDDQENAARLEYGRAAAVLEEKSQALGATGMVSQCPGADWLRRVEDTTGRLHNAMLTLRELDAAGTASDAVETDASASARARRRQRFTEWLALGLLMSGGLLGIAVAVMRGAWLAAALALPLAVGALMLALQRRRPPRTGTDRQASATLRQQAGKALEEARSALAALADEAGISLDADQLPWSFSLLCQRLRDLDQARARMAEIQADLDTITTERRERLTALQGFLAQLPATGMQARDLGDTDALGAALATVEANLDAARLARQERLQAERAAAQAQQDLERASAALAEIYHRCGLTPEQRPVLLDRIARRSEWSAARQTLAEATATERAHTLRLDAADAEVVEAIDADDDTGLRQRMDAFRQEAGRLEELISRREAIRGAIRQAERDHPLEQRRAERDRQFEALVERRALRLRADLGHWLLDTLATDNRRLHQPAAVRLADAYLRQFTHHAFALELDDSGRPGARYLPGNEPRALEALSVGTRMQLLIALRIAWTTTREGTGPRLPLFLDEALTTTDPERFRTVAGSLHKLVTSERRQLIYLTAQPLDSRRWEQATGEPPHQVDLADPADTGRDVTDVRAALPHAEVPAPTDDDPVRYGRRLAVPAIDPHQPAGAIHPFHVLRDDLSLLHTLLERYRLHSLGQIGSFIDGNIDGGPLGRDTADRLTRRIRVAEAWLEAWRTGRGRPVDRGVLEASNASGWTSLIDALCERADSVGNDSDAFIRSLSSDSIRGLGEKRISQLRDWLVDEGYLDTASPLDADGRHRRAIAAVPPDHADEAAAVIRWLEAGLADQL